MDNVTADQPGFWESRYQSKRTVWDMGQPYPAMVRWLADHPGPGKALVIGCGKGFDALALAAHGYHVTGIDFAPSAIAEASRLAAERQLEVRFLVKDLFEMGAEFDGAFDLVFEHACLCAMPRERWRDYAALMASLLAPGGRLVGGFFTGFDPDGPPFGISLEELQELLSPDFKLISTERIPDSEDQEHWIELRLVTD